jgi:putative copper resistance protein D
VPVLPWEIAAKAFLYAAVLSAMGTCAIRSLLLPWLARLPPEEIDAVARAVAPVRTRAAVAVLVALGLRALTQTAAVFDWPAVLSWDAVHVVAMESRWGSAWHLQVAAASVFLVASAWAGRARQASDASATVATIACVALCYSMPLLGHGAGTRWRLLLHGTHVLGAGIWAGTLIALVLIKVSSARRLTLLRGVSPLALSGAVILGLAGVVMAWSYLGPVSNLWTTSYGRLLTLKLALVGGTAACGFVNWRRFAAERRGAARSERLGPVATELVLVAAVVVVTAALTEVAHP